MHRLLPSMMIPRKSQQRNQNQVVYQVCMRYVKQDSLQSSLSALNRSRAAEMEHQRGQPSAEQGLQQPRRDLSSFSGPMATPSTTSTPLERKQRAWYVTDSFAEQFSPPGSRCAQSCFEIGCQLPAVHVPPLQQQREALGRSPVYRRLNTAKTKTSKK